MCLVERSHLPVNECLCHHLKMSEIFTLLKEISILIQAPNNVEKKKNQYFPQTSESINTLSSVVISIKSPWGLKSVVKVKLNPEMSCPHCHYFYPPYSTIKVVIVFQAVACHLVLLLSSESV